MKGGLVPVLTRSFLMGASSVLVLSSGSLLAQTAPGSQPLQDFRPQEENVDVFSGRGNQSSGIMDIIHRANFGNIQSATDFRANSNQNVLDAAAQFRQQQLRAIQQNRPQQAIPGQVTPVLPAVVTPGSGTK